MTLRVLLITLLGLGSLGAQADDVMRGDAAWARRAEGEREGRPSPDPIGEALEAYEAALSASPGDLEARWKLLRALHFAGDFSGRDAKERRAVFDRAREASEAGLERLEREVGAGERLGATDLETLGERLDAAGLKTSDVARLYFWAAINWGAWSRVVGLLGAVRQGVANRLYRYTSLAVALEPGYEDGGPPRLLGRLHAELPRVPFLSGWVDRSKAIPLVESAYALAPEDPGNRLLLALTLLDLAPERRNEALDLLRQVERLTPRPSMRIEDLAMRKQALRRLDAELSSRGPVRNRLAHGS
jgi:tetratricopeptide (TPR) repeat protein